MDRLEAMLTLEMYGESTVCKTCGHTMPSAVCSSKPDKGEGAPCPLLVELEANEAYEDVAARAKEIRIEAELS